MDGKHPGGVRVRSRPVGCRDCMRPARFGSVARQPRVRVETNERMDELHTACDLTERPPAHAVDVVLAPLRLGG